MSTIKPAFEVGDFVIYRHKGRYANDHTYLVGVIESIFINVNNSDTNIGYSLSGFSELDLGLEEILENRLRLFYKGSSEEALRFARSFEYSR